MAAMRFFLMLLMSVMAMAMDTATDIWLTRPEVSERIKVPVATLNQWGSQSRGPKYARFGRHCRYRLSDVIAWENAQLTGGAV